MEVGTLLIRLVVDAVSEVLRIPGGINEPLSGVISDVHTELISGVAKTRNQLILLLDAKKILNQGEQLCWRWRGKRFLRKVTYRPFAFARRSWPISFCM